MKKRVLAILMVAVMSLSLLAGCGSTEDETVAESSDVSSTEQVQETTDAQETADVQETEEASLRTEYPLTVDVYNAEGEKLSVTFESAPERIVSTQLSITELLLELGLKDKIVGIMDNDNPVEEELQAELDDLTSLGYKSTISKEAILAADPDIVMGKSTRMFTDNAIGTVESYLEQGINVYTQLASVDVIDQSLDNILEDIRTIGKIFDVQEAANAYADSLEEQLNATLESVSAKTEGQEETSVILMAGFQDGTYLAYSSTMNSVLLSAVNAVNVLDAGGNGMTLENLISLNPDAIIYVTSNRYAETDGDVVERLLSEEAIQDVTAIANEKIVKIGYDDIMDYGARIIFTTEVLADFLYEE